MKKRLTLLILSLLAAFLLAACGGTATTETVEEIPFETCTEIQEDIEREFSGVGAYLVPMKFIVSDAGYGDSVTVSIRYDGMVLAVGFPDYVNAGIIFTKEVAEKYGVNVCDLKVTFMKGDDILSWHSTNLETGVLYDSYSANSVTLPDQRLPDLISRYGCTNEFFDLSEYEQED